MSVTLPLKLKPKQKVSISLSPSMLQRVDDRARALELPRSVVIQMALREYLDKK